MTLDAFIGLVMLLVLLGATFIGVPTSFTLLFLAFTFGYVGMGAHGLRPRLLRDHRHDEGRAAGGGAALHFMGFITEQAGRWRRVPVHVLLDARRRRIRAPLFLVVVVPATASAMATASSPRRRRCSASWPWLIMIKSVYAPSSCRRDHRGGHAGQNRIRSSLMLIVMGLVLGVRG